MSGIRIASSLDAPEILAIYTPYILNEATSFETEVPSIAEVEKRIEHYLENYPWLVCTINEKFAGYAYASNHRDREAYQWSCECSVYVHENFKGMGVGKALYTALFQVLKIQGVRNVYAGITLPNEHSVRLHEKLGFELLAVYENVGYKLGGWKTVGWWKLQLNEYDPKPLPPHKFSVMDRSLLSDIFKRASGALQPKLID